MDQILRGGGMAAATNSKGDLILAAIGGVGLIGLALAAAFAIPKAAEMQRVANEAAIQNMPDKSALLAALKRNFPEDYRAFEDEVRMLDRTGDSRYAGRRVDVRLRQIVAAKQRLAVNAPDLALAALALPHSRYYAFLEEFDTEMCGRYATSGLTFEDSQALNGTEGLALDQAVTASLLDAAGMAKPAPLTPRKRGIPPASADAIVSQMRQQGTSPRLMALLQRPQGSIGAPAADQCAIGRELSRALTALPDNVTADYFRFLLDVGK
jgi:hypothetical protein